jgi:hypothetical protein
MAVRSGDVNGPSRPLTPAIRAELGLPERAAWRYPWGFAALVVGVACVPLMLAAMWMACTLAAAAGLLILPLFRWFENREGAWREGVYRHGLEARGRVLDVEPAGQARDDHLVRVEFRAGEQIIRASILGCRLASRGLVPDDDIVILYAGARPTRCLVVAKAAPSSD